MILYSPPYLIIAVPSRAALTHTQWQCTHKHGDISPHVMAVPLLFRKEEDEDDSEERHNSATTPIQLLVSNDFAIGVALVHHSKVRMYVPDYQLTSDFFTRWMHFPINY